MASALEGFPGTSSGGSTNRSGAVLMDVSNNADPDTVPLKPKKRSRHENMWKKNLTKTAKAKVLEHRRYSSAAIVPARELLIIECIHKCQNKLSIEEKQTVFSKFNALANHQTQNVYLQSCTIPLENGRFDYILHLHNRIEVVCQKLFLNIHGIKRSRLRKKVLNRNVSIQDGRGRHENHKKVPDEAISTVRTFFENLDARESHYSRRANKNKKFLDSHETITSLYAKFVEEQPHLRETVKLCKFVKIFNYEYNISFGFPRSDICETCEKLNAKIGVSVMENDEEEETNLRLEHQNHLIDAETFVSKMSKSTINATNNTHVFICFDFQKNLPFPVTNVNKEFFLRQMWLNNFGIRDLRTGETHMFTYCEHFARKGSSEVISCLKYYIENVIPITVRHLHLFCDNSSGQNKHRFLFAYLLSLCPSRFRTIHLDFPLPGHSRMTIDGDFAHIERKKKKKDKIEYPSDWIELIRKSRNKKPFHIVYLNHPVTNDLTNDDYNTPIAQVYDYKTSLTPLLHGSLGRISAVKGLLYNRRGVFTRNSMDGLSHSRFVILKRNVTVATLQKTINNTALAYDDYLPISAEKYENLQTLLDTFYRPSEWIFYDVITMRQTEDEEVDDVLVH